MPISAISGQWTQLTLPAFPPPRFVHDGDAISVDLFFDAPTGERLIDDIRFGPPPTLVAPVPAVPTVSGAHNFSAADVELQIRLPRITLNGAPQDTATVRGASPLARGPLIWFYLPNHGRYVLSITARSELDFKKAGEVRGGTITFTLGGDSIKLECQNPIVIGFPNAAYNLYVLHDPEWEPTSQGQKGQFAMGSAAPGELTALKRE